VKRYIGEHHRSVVTYSLLNSNDSQLTYILEQSKDNPALLAALQPVLDARRKVADAQAAVDDTNARLRSLREEEDRERANVTALKEADKSASSRFIRDLNETEDKLRAAQAELDTRTAALNSAKSDLANAIENLQVDTGTKD
jgi:peptidoglycan hydrolase CwlO-like protein